jgi:energy-coupling factor transporter transmembrane protein EcfT
VTPVSPAMQVSPVMQRWRVALIAIGAGLVILGAILAILELSPSSYLGIAAWLVGALIVHDGIVAASVLVASLLIRRFGARVPLAVVLVVQGALVVWAIIAALVLPIIVKQAIGTANPSILPLDYVTNLAVFTGVLAALTVLSVAAILAIRMRARRAPQAR